jgi:hypothetical protein
MPKNISSYHVGVAAEAFAAGFFAQAGYDVSVQYGANQPDYDLVIGKDKTLLKISVKGSQDGGWGLVQGYIEPPVDYQKVPDVWLKNQSSDVVFCLVQFEDVSVGQCPRAYLLTATEIANHLKKARNGKGSTILYENYSYKKGLGAGSTDKIPDEWGFSVNRIESLLKTVN